MQDASGVAIASRVYLANGIVLWLCERAFWPLFFVRLVTEIELSPLQLVLLGTVYEAGIFFSEIPTGIVADIYSRRLSIIISFVLGGTAFIISGLVGGYALLVASQILVGIASTFRSGAETAWVTDELGSAERAEPLIIRRGRIQMFAGIAGVILFAAVAVLFSLSAAIVLIGALLIAWGLVLTAIMPEENFTRTEGEGWSEFAAMLGNGWRAVNSIKALRILAIVIVIGGIAKEAIDRLDIQRLVDVGMPNDIDEAVVVGVLVVIRYLIAAGLLTIAQRFVSGRKVVPALCTILLGIAIGITILAHVELLWIAGLGLVVQGGFHTAKQPLVDVWANTFASSEARATIHSFIGQAESFGEVIGGIALGAVAQIFTVPTAMTVSLLLFAGSAIYASTASAVWGEP